MNISIKATGLALTNAIDTYIREKFGKLDKFLSALKPEDALGHVEVGKTTDHHKKGKIFHAEFRLRLPGSDVYAEEDSEELYEAIDLVVAETRRQLVHNKEKNKTRRRPRI